jgi:hypothetical protein
VVAFPQRFLPKIPLSDTKFYKGKNSALPQVTDILGGKKDKKGKKKQRFA